MQIVGAIFALLVGTVFVYGGVRRWKFLVDPPTELWFLYSQSLLRCIFQPREMRVVTILQGIVCFIASVMLVMSTWFPDGRRF